MFVRKWGYTYFISFKYKNGFGNTYITLKNKIKSVEIIHKMQEYIEKKYNLESVAIMSYQLICKEKVEDERN